jgi:hypothetical protein
MNGDDTIYKWSTRGGEACEALEAMAPYLEGHKREQALELLEDAKVA